MDFVLMSSLAYCFLDLALHGQLLLSQRSKKQLYCEEHAMAQCGYSSLIESDTLCGNTLEIP